MHMDVFQIKNLIGIKKFKYCISQKSLKEKKDILKKMWFHFGRVIGEYPHLDKIKITDSNILQIDSIKKFIRSYKKWELYILFCTHRKLGIIFTPINSKWI